MEHLPIIVAIVAPLTLIVLHLFKLYHDLQEQIRKLELRLAICEERWHNYNMKGGSDGNPN